MKSILYKTNMLQAIYEGRKNLTRRLMKPQPAGGARKSVFSPSGIEDVHGYIIKPPYLPGEVAYVKETWGVGSRPDPYGGHEGIEYKADEKYLDEYGDDLPCNPVKAPEHINLCDYPSGWKSPLIMPAWAARAWQRIISVRAERLQDITEEDAIREGITLDETIFDDNGSYLDTCRKRYQILWDDFAEPPYQWDDNPWVWRIETELLRELPKEAKG